MWGRGNLGWGLRSRNYQLIAPAQLLTGGIIPVGDPTGAVHQVELCDRVEGAVFIGRASLLFTEAVVVIEFGRVSQATVSPRLPEKARAARHAFFDGQLDDAFALRINALLGGIRVIKHFI